MIEAVQFLSRAEFEARTPIPSDAAISIGDDDQDAPKELALYGKACRQQFLDLEPHECWKHGITVDKCMTQNQAREVAGFIRQLHEDEYGYRLIVHCEMGVSRSAAVALAAATLADVTLPEVPCHANAHVVDSLARELGIEITIPPMRDGPVYVPGKLAWEY